VMAVVTALTMALPMGVFDFLGLRRSMTTDLATLADALARNSTAAMMFRDNRAAQDVLEALRAEPSVTAACLYTADGKPFAKYVRRGSRAQYLPPVVEPPLTRFEPGRLIQFMLFLDLDHFKVINDSLGHSFGDLLLQNVATRLKRLAREQDAVARIGGDEFLIVLTGITAASDVGVAAERIMSSMATEFVVQGRSFTINCSIGVSMFPEHGVDTETLVKNADAAMYCAKDSGRNVFRFFTEQMNAEVLERMTLENGRRLALDNKELFLVYQPQMEIATGTMVGLEALLRWRHPELGFVPPDRFIRVAENSGLIIPIGEWVLKTACATAKRWQEENPFEIPVAVNVSAIQFRQDGFLRLVKRVLVESGLAPQNLELELTESMLLFQRTDDAASPPRAEEHGGKTID